MDELRGEWRKLYNDTLNDLYSSPDIVLLIKSRRMCWSGHACVWGTRNGIQGFAGKN
jgi:hypothetical protein